MLERRGQQGAIRAAGADHAVHAAAAKQADSQGTLEPSADVPMEQVIFNLQSNGQVPEPATLALLGIGLAGLGFSRRKRAAN